MRSQIVREEEERERRGTRNELLMVPQFVHELHDDGTTRQAAEREWKKNMERDVDGLSLSMFAGGDGEERMPGKSRWYPAGRPETKKNVRGKRKKNSQIKSMERKGRTQQDENEKKSKGKGTTKKKRIIKAESQCEKRET